MDVVSSGRYDGPRPEVTVVVSTYGRGSQLAELLAELEHQSLGLDRFEVIVVDDASPDDTWDILRAVAAATRLRLRATRLAENGGAGPGRNAGVELARADVVAFTDDDCLPEPGWLAGLLAAMETGADVVQGRTRPADDRGSRPGPWDRTVAVEGPTPLFETCNIAYRRSLLLSVGGFRPGAAVPGNPFGEDAELGARAVAAGAAVAFAPDAVVRHRWTNRPYREWLRERARARLFPALVERCPPLAAKLVAGVFLSPATARADLAAVSVIAAAAMRRPIVLLGTLPWAARTWREAGTLAGRPAGVRALQLAAGDAVRLGALVVGSVRARRPVL